MVKHTVSLVVILAFAMLASGKDKKVVEGDYHDGVLVRFEMVSSGVSCSSSGSGKVNDDGDVTVSNSGSCSDDSIEHYTVAVGEMSYVLAPAIAHPKTALLTLGYSAAFQKRSVLYAQLPGTAVKVRIVKDKVYIKLDERESPYKVVALASTTK